MHKFITFIKEFRIPNKKEVSGAIASFSRKESTIFFGAVFIALVSIIILVAKINNNFMDRVPASGGTITEGIIGMPILVNPVLAVSDADKDMTAIVYSGLMRETENNKFIPDLAESYTISADGMTYTFILKDDLKFHNGAKLTADDVIFTIEKIKDPIIKSPRKISWDGVEVSKKDDLTVVFKLKQPYISFMDNTTIGILPSSLWKNVKIQEFGVSPLNVKAVGSGPYKIESVSKNKDSIPERYELKYFKNFALGVPHIKYINIVSFASEKELMKALLDHSIDQAGGLNPENAASLEKSNYDINTSTLSRTFGLFFNENRNKIFADTSVVKAFDKAINREDIINQVLSGYGTVIHNPIPEAMVKDDYDSNSSIEEAISILEKAGWKKGEDGIMMKGGTTTKTITKKVGKKTITQTVKVNNGAVTRLSFSITTGDRPELRQAVSLIKNQLEKVGAEVNIDKIYETGQLSQEIRSRDYEALFFGQIINHESDLYSFWHSSQITDPGLNIAIYNNKSVDSILESIQKTLKYEDRIPKYKSFINEFNKDPQALLIYSPKYLYASSLNINNNLINTLSTPSDRFVSIYDWYAKEDLVWKIFTK